MKIENAYSKEVIAFIGKLFDDMSVPQIRRTRLLERKILTLWERHLVGIAREQGYSNLQIAKGLEFSENKVRQTLKTAGE